MSELWWVESAAEPRFGVQIGPAILANVHAPEKCVGEACVLHNPSDHHMRDWTLNFRSDIGVMERICPMHGIGHPDPDSLAWHEREGREWVAVHGCCGCCRTSRP